MNRLAVLVSCLCLAAACDKKDGAAAPAPAGAAAPGDKPTDKPAAAAAPNGTGLADPANDPKIVALAKPVLACEWKGSWFDDECAAFKAWKAADDAFADHKADATLVAFLEDSDLKVRDLALRRLRANGSEGAFADKALSARMVGVAEKAKGWTEWPAYTLGGFVGHIKIGESGLFPRIKALVTSADGDVNIRRGAIEALAYANEGNKEVWDLTRESIKDANAQVALYALRALWMGSTNETHDARCDIYKENIDNARDEIAAEAVSNIVRPQAGCQKHFDAVLASLTARVKGKKLPDKTFVRAFGDFCEPKLATAPQVKKATGLAHQVADDKKAEAKLRVAALEASLACDPKGGKAYVGKFKKDADNDVKEAATEMLTKK